jgi:putative phosphoribosyl transferase
MYKDRLAAGEALAEELKKFSFENVSVLAVPRGGVVVAVPVAKLYGTSLQALIARKIGHPQNPEFAVGAVMPDGSAVYDGEALQTYRVSRAYLEDTVAKEYAELRRRMLLYTGSENPPDVEGKTAIVVDDGMATGYTIRAAVGWLKNQKPKKVVVAVPVAPVDAVRKLEKEVDLVVCPLQPEVFMSVGSFYDSFPQVTDSEVIGWLKELQNNF